MRIRDRNGPTDALDQNRRTRAPKEKQQIHPSNRSSLLGSATLHGPHQSIVRRYGHSFTHSLTHSLRVVYGYGHYYSFTQSRLQVQVYGIPALVLAGGTWRMRSWACWPPAVASRATRSGWAKTTCDGVGERE